MENQQICHAVDCGQGAPDADVDADQLQHAVQSRQDLLGDIVHPVQAQLRAWADERQGRNTGVPKVDICLQPSCDQRGPCTCMGTAARAMKDNQDAPRATHTPAMLHAVWGHAAACCDSQTTSCAVGLSTLAKLQRWWTPCMLLSERGLLGGVQTTT